MINDILKYNYDLCDYRVSSLAFARSLTIYLHVKYENCYLSSRLKLTFTSLLFKSKCTIFVVIVILHILIRHQLYTGQFHFTSTYKIRGHL